MWALIFLAAFAVSLALSLLLVPLFRRAAIAAGVLDHPAERKVHRAATPLLGGGGIVASICLAVMLGLAGVFALRPLLPADVARHLPGVAVLLPRLALLLGGGVMVFLFGLVDDVRGLKAAWKLVGQTLIALVLFASGMRITIFIPNTAVSLVLTVGWILFVTNSFNLLDNMNGLAAGTAVIAACLFFLYALESGALFIAVLLAVFIGAVLGFLRYNFPRASVFMGECGSTFLGYFLAVIPVAATYYHADSPSYLPVLAPLFILALPIYDTLSVMLIRAREGRSVFTPGKDHFSHRLVGFGLAPVRAVAAIYLLTLGVGLPALVLKHLPLKGGLLLLLQAAIFLAVVSALSTAGRGKGK